MCCLAAYITFGKCVRNESLLQRKRDLMKESNMLLRCSSLSTVTQIECDGHCFSSILHVAFIVAPSPSSRGA